VHSTAVDLAAADGLADSWTRVATSPRSSVAPRVIMLAVDRRTKRSRI